MFDKLVKACKAVRAKLEDEQRALSSNEVATLRANIPEGTEGSKLIAGITSLTSPEAVRALAQLSADERG